MLEGIFGNLNAERVLLHVYHYKEIHPSAIAQDYKVAINPIKLQLKRFEQAGVLASKTIGRARVYFFNPKSPYVSPVKEIIERFYNSIPLADREKLFKTRRRPRREGKPIL